MRRAVAGTACALAMFIVLMLGHPFGASTGRSGVVKGPPPQSPFLARVRSTTPVPGAWSHYDGRAQASFALRLTTDRQAQLLVRAAELQVQKTVAPDGGFTVVLEADGERLVVAMRLAGADVSRGGTTVHVEFGQAGDEEFLDVHRLLAGSKALRLHRTLASNLEPRTLSTPGGAATLLTDAFLGLLDGDVGAVDRLGSAIARHTGGRLARIRRDEMDSCYEWWENEVTTAFHQLLACKMEYNPWNPVKEVCNVRYIMRVEAAWFQFLGCCAVPIRAE